MPYSSVGELPQQVRGALDPEDQQKWLDTFNHALQQYGDDRSAFQVAWHMVSKGDNVRRISGILSREVVDKQGDRVNADSLNSEFQDLIWDYGATVNDVHTNRPMGPWFDSKVETGTDGVRQVRVWGVVNKGKPYFDEFWDDVRGGKKAGLSVGIMKIDPHKMCADGKCWNQVDKLQVFEGSAVPKGACPGAELDDINFSSKSENQGGASGGSNGVRTMSDEQGTGKAAQSPAAGAALANKGDDGGALAEALQKILAGQDAILKRIEALEGGSDGAPDGGESANDAPGVEDKAALPAGESPQPNGFEGPYKKDTVGDVRYPPKPYKLELDQNDPNQGKPSTGLETKCNKCGHVNKSAQIKQKREMASKSGVQTPRPELRNDGSVGMKNALADLLADPVKLSKMSAVELERWGDKILKGEF